MIRSTAQLALPSVGPLLGAAYDRGFWTLIHSWRVATTLLASECLIAIVPGLAASNIGNWLLVVWAFYAMANAIRLVFDSEYRMTNVSAGHMIGTALLTALCIVPINFLAIFALLGAGQNIRSWAFAVPGVVVSVWLLARWSCGQALGAQGLPAIKALRESYRLTAIAFWPSLVIEASGYAVGFAINFLIWDGIGMLSKVLPASIAAAALITAAPLVFAGQLYSSQSFHLATCMWLKALQAVQPAEPAAAA